MLNHFLNFICADQVTPPPLVPIIINLWRSLGYDDGIVDEEFNIDIAFSDFRGALRAHFPQARYAEGAQGDAVEVLTSIIDQIELEVGEFMEGGKPGFRSRLYSVRKRSIKCCGCGKTRSSADDQTLFRTFIYNEKQRKEHEMSTLMENLTTSERVSTVNACVMCHEIHDFISSESIIGKPKIIFYFTNIIDYDGEKGKKKKKCSFKMILQLWITVEDKEYILRGVISHTGTNKHLKKKDAEQEGHYITYRRDGDCWYCFDDKDVIKVEFARVGRHFQTENVCMLLYERIKKKVN